jgi:hypothetical protein
MHTDGQKVRCGSPNMLNFEIVISDRVKKWRFKFLVINLQYFQFYATFPFLRPTDSKIKKWGKFHSPLPTRVIHAILHIMSPFKRYRTE